MMVGGLGAGDEPRHERDRLGEAGKANVFRIVLPSRTQPGREASAAAICSSDRSGI